MALLKKATTSIEQSSYSESAILDVLNFVVSLSPDRDSIANSISAVANLKALPVRQQREMSLLVYDQLESSLCPRYYKIGDLRKRIIDNFDLNTLRASFIDVLLSEEEQKIRKLEKEIKSVVREIFPSLGYDRLQDFITEKTADNLLNGLTIESDGFIDFALVEQRFFQLPIAWLKLVEKFLNDILASLLKLKDEAVKTGEKKEIIQVSQEAKKIFNSLGMQDFIESGVLRDLPATIRNKNNEHIPASLSGATLKNEAGVIQGMVIVAKDLRTLKKYAKQRLNQITPILKKVASGDFSQKIEIPEREDEFTEHMQSLNVMVDDFREMVQDVNQKKNELSAQNAELEKTFAALQEAKTGLEEKVKERTSELEKAKEGLEDKVSQRTKELNELNLKLEGEVAKRTAELQEKLVELKRFNKIAVDRELKMIELKQEVRQLKEQLQPQTGTLSSLS